MAYPGNRQRLPYNPAVAQRDPFMPAVGRSDAGRVSDFGSAGSFNPAVSMRLPYNPAVAQRNPFVNSATASSGRGAKTPAGGGRQQLPLDRTPAPVTPSVDPVATAMSAPTQVVNDFGSFVSSLQTAPMYRGNIGYSDVLGRYVRPGDYMAAPELGSAEQVRADWLRMTAGVAADPSQRSTAGPLGLSAYNLVPTFAGVRGVTYGADGQAIDSGPVTYRSSADAVNTIIRNATDAQLMDPKWMAVVNSIAREGGLLGPSAEEQALLRQRIEAEMAAAQRRGQQALADWNRWNPGLDTPTPMGTSVSGFVPFIGTDAAGNPVLANDPQAMEKIRQGLIQSMGGGYDPFQNPYEQQAMAQGFGNRGETGYTPV